jgi:hypothetical protein
MTEVKTIKDVDDDVWSRFKSIAARNKMKMGEMFEKMVNEYEKESKAWWDETLKPKSKISDKEAERMMQVVRETREEYGFRK